ncbi:MAG: 50S ribosomal protein L18 [Candidatus Paceibacterota bacterium]
MAKTNQKTLKRESRKRRIRSKVSGTLERPRVSVFRSNKFIYAQLINDEEGKTIVSCTSATESKGNKTEKATKTGKDFAKQIQEKGIKKVVFDRGGYIYTGRIKAFAEALREAGLDF